MQNQDKKGQNQDKEGQNQEKYGFKYASLPGSFENFRPNPRFIPTRTFKN